jgi:hypothetical protein
MNKNHPLVQRLKRFVVSAWHSVDYEIKSTLFVLIFIALVLGAALLISLSMLYGLKLLFSLLTTSIGKWLISALFGVLLVLIGVKASESTYDWLKEHWERSKEANEDEQSNE